MVFSSIMFLSLFLPVFLLVYYISPGIRLKNGILVLFSLFFYAWGEPVWILALLFSGAIDYIHGRIIERHFFSWQAKAALISSLVLNLGLLAVFKYSGFIVSNINTVFNLQLNVPTFALPLGISFYTFQTLSYTIDVYKGEAKAQKSFVAFLAYVSMFPQLVAGPIVRYTDIEGSINERTFSRERFSAGITRFSAGLAKKVLLANSAGSVAKYLLEGELTRLSTLSSWLGIIMFSFQIYFDFSGYSDMAIGLGKMIGFEFKENFDYPYTSKSISEFWRRWHISLSSFFRDYIYIPLGGNRKRYIRNIAVVWFLTGLWHGASWNFILWGLYFGLIILMEKYFIQACLKKLPSVFSRIYSLFLIVCGWMIFYFTDLGKLRVFLRSAFSLSNFYDFTFQSSFVNHIFLLAVLVIASTPLPSRLWRKLEERSGAAGNIQAALNAIAIIVCFMALLGQTYNPFLYFRF